MKSVALSVHSKIKKADHRGEISTINRVFFGSIKTQLQSKCDVTQISLELLDKANIYTWLAYTLYDDVLDKNDSSLVATANVLMRRAVANYIESGIEVSLIESYFSTVDTANQMELSFRLKEGVSLSKLKPLLYKKSIAHCLGQVWILKQTNVLDLQEISKGFEDYCSARQLNDDIFDWRDDISNNQLTYAIGVLQNEIAEQPPGLKNLDERDRLNIAFWHTGLESLCDEVKNYTRNSAAHLSNVLEENSEYIDSFIKPLGAHADMSKKKHQLEKKRLNLNTSGITAP